MEQHDEQDAKPREPAARVARVHLRLEPRRYGVLGLGQLRGQRHPVDGRRLILHRRRHGLRRRLPIVENDPQERVDERQRGPTQGREDRHGNKEQQSANGR